MTAKFGLAPARCERRKGSVSDELIVDAHSSASIPLQSRLDPAIRRLHIHGPAVVGIGQPDVDTPV